MKNKAMAEDSRHLGDLRSNREFSVADGSALRSSWIPTIRVRIQLTAALVVEVLNIARIQSIRVQIPETGIGQK